MSSGIVVEGWTGGGGTSAARVEVTSDDGGMKHRVGGEGRLSERSLGSLTGTICRSSCDGLILVKKSCVHYDRFLYEECDVAATYGRLHV